MHSTSVLTVPRLPSLGQPLLFIMFYSVSVPLAPKPCKLQRSWAICGFPQCFTVFLGLGRSCPINYDVSKPCCVFCLFEFQNHANRAVPCVSKTKKNVASSATRVFLLFEHCVASCSIYDCMYKFINNHNESRFSTETSKNNTRFLQIWA